MLEPFAAGLARCIVSSFVLGGLATVVLAACSGLGVSSEDADTKRWTSRRSITADLGAVGFGGLLQRAIDGRPGFRRDRSSVMSDGGTGRSRTRLRRSWGHHRHRPGCVNPASAVEVRQTNSPRRSHVACTTASRMMSSLAQRPTAMTRSWTARRHVERCDRLGHRAIGTRFGDNLAAQQPRAASGGRDDEPSVQDGHVVGSHLARQPDQRRTLFPNLRRSRCRAAGSRIAGKRWGPILRIEESRGLVVATGDLRTYPRDPP